MSTMDSMSGIHIEDDLFYFESDHLALRGNKDYSEVLKAVLLLTVHREKAIKDYKKVSELKSEALQNPLSVINKIKNKEELGVPPILEIPKLPKIDFDKYEVKLPEDELKHIYSDNNQTNVQEIIKPEERKNVQQWTVEEQKRLEELLIVYPPEPIEMRRFQKIAKALGTRTPLQVCSRVQKYFLKLYKAGLPVPGRLPKHNERCKAMMAGHKHQKYNHLLHKPTTFFPELSVPVTLNDLDNIPGPSSQQSTPTSSSSGGQNYLNPSSYHIEPTPKTQQSDDKLKLELLKRVKQEKLKTNEAPFYHTGYSCDYCSESPIIGSRWHCITCVSSSIDFCTDCVVSQLYSSNPHPLIHKLYTYTNDFESPTMDNNSDSELTNNCVSSNESDYNYKVLNDSNNVQSDDDFNDVTIKEEQTSDMEQDEQNLSYQYLHSNLMFHEND